MAEFLLEGRPISSPLDSSPTQPQSRRSSRQTAGPLISSPARPIPPRIATRESHSGTSTRRVSSYSLVPCHTSPPLSFPTEPPSPNLGRLGSKKRNRLRNTAQLSPQSPADIHYLDWEAGYELPRPESPLLQLLSLGDVRLPESLSDLTSSKPGKERGIYSRLGAMNLTQMDKNVKAQLRRCLYGLPEVRVYEATIQSWLSDATKRTVPATFVVDEPLLRLVLHALCRYYGLESYSETNCQTGERTTCVLFRESTRIKGAPEAPPPLLPVEPFTRYFYGVA